MIINEYNLLEVIMIIIDYISFKHLILVTIINYDCQQGK